MTLLCIFNIITQHAPENKLSGSPANPRKTLLISSKKEYILL